MLKNVKCKVELYVIGDRTDLNINNINIEMSFIEPMSQSDLLKFLEKKHFIIKSNTFDTFSMIVAECMSFGLIPIVNKNTGINVFIKNEFNGFIYSEDSQNELSDLLNNIYDRTYDLFKISANARKIYEQLNWTKDQRSIFSWLQNGTMIKVCHIVNLITGKSDGVYSHLKMIFKNSDKTKFQHFLIFQGGENIEKEVAELGIKVFVIPSLKKKVSLRPFIDVYKILKANEIDIIHTHLVKPYAIAGLLNIVLKRNFIFNYNGLFIGQNPYYGFVEKSIYKTIHGIINLFNAVDVVLVPSVKSKELIIEETKLFPEPIVYYNGYFLENKNSKVDKDFWQKIQELKNKYFIIAVIGRLERQKRIDIALELFKEVSLKNDQLFMVIFGDGILKNQLIKMSSELGISSRVIFFDYVPDVVNYLKFINILLFTSDWEGMPLSMWEAMANQVPVVAPDVGGFREILEENDCGLIYEPGNLKDAEKKILQLINDEQLRTKLGQNGKLAIEAKYNEKEFIQQIERVYFQLMSQ